MTISSFTTIDVASVPITLSSFLFFTCFISYTNTFRIIFEKTFLCSFFAISHSLTICIWFSFKSSTFSSLEWTFSRFFWDCFAHSLISINTRFIIITSIERSTSNNFLSSENCTFSNCTFSSFPFFTCFCLWINTRLFMWTTLYFRTIYNFFEFRLTPKLTCLWFFFTFDFCVFLTFVIIHI